MVVLVFCLVPGATAQVSAPSAAAQGRGPRPKPDVQDFYKVVYTGRMFGYYRFPEVQTFGPQKCEGEIDEQSAPEAYEFSQAIRKADPKDTALRVATGDNFGPFLLARQMWIDDKGGKRLEEKEDYTEDNGHWESNENLSPAAYDTIERGDSPVPIDNVGCFIRKMHFDAIVPGEQDFYFGPARLQGLAKYLADPLKTSAPPTHMLGANLYMKTNELPIRLPR
ncbi:MAG: hypothetical protein ABSB35_13100 [Bryobacteraceae bacterium]|jgi:hypothetical protein